MSSRAAKSGQLSRRERKKIETRQKILDAALKLMTARSYDEVKVDEICEEADIALATFFAYFPTKSALITAFNERVFAKLSAQLQSYDVPAPEKLELLRALMITEWEAQSDLMRSLVREADSGARGGPGSMAVDENLIALTAGIVREGQESGAFRKDLLAELVGMTLVMAWTGVAVGWARGIDDSQSRANHRAVLDLVLYGVARRD